MSLISPFFSDVLAALESPDPEIHSHMIALKMITELFGIEADDCELQDKLILIPVAPASVVSTKQSLLPVLLQEAGTNNFYVLANNQLIYATIERDIIPVLQLQNFKIENAWQCSPSALPIYNGIYSLINGALKYFRRDIVSCVMRGIAVALFTLFTSFVSGYLFAHIYSVKNHLWIVMSSFIITFIAVNVFNYLNELNLKNLNLKLLLYTLPGVWHHILSLPLANIQKHQSGDLAQKIFDYETALSMVLSVMLSLSFSFASIICLLCYMLYCQFKLALIFILLCSLMLFIKLYLAPRSMRCMELMMAAQSNLTQFVNEVLLQIHKVRSSGVENEIFQRWLKMLLQTKTQAEQSMYVELVSTLIEASVPICLMLSVYVILFWQSNQSDTYTLLQFMICAGQFTALFDKLSAQMVSLIRLLPNLSRLQCIASEPIESRCGRTRITAPLRGEIEFDHVSFRHRDSGLSILQDVSLSVPAGQFIAIIGPSGAGKSTLFKLLMGFESPEAGIIKIDGLPLSSYSTCDLRKQFGVVMQTTNIFPGTIYSNLAAQADITHDEAWQLAHLVGLDKDIAAMPMKMHTFISDNAGESLSGGQKQKLLIARALASKPRILLLDEATSALDNASQAWIFKHLKELQITRVVIAHRTSTIVGADCIYTLVSGRLVPCAI